MQIYLRKWITASNISFGNDGKHLNEEKTSSGMTESTKT